MHLSAGDNVEHCLVQDQIISMVIVWYCLCLQYVDILTWWHLQIDFDILTYWGLVILYFISKENIVFPKNQESSCSLLLGITLMSKLSMLIWRCHDVKMSKCPYIVHVLQVLILKMSWILNVFSNLFLFSYFYSKYNSFCCKDLYFISSCGPLLLALIKPWLLC